MKNLKNVRYGFAAIAAIAVLGLTTQANAQTETVDVDVTVQNTLTLTVTDTINFGTIVAISDPVLTATVPISPAGVLGAPASGGGTAYIAIVDSAAASEGSITVEDGAAGANINVDIPSAAIVEPTFGGATFDLASWTYRWNGAASAAIVPDVAEVVVFDAAFNAGVNDLDVGVTLTTQAAAVYGDGAYAGQFDVNFSY